MKVAPNPEVFCSAGKGSLELSRHQWLTALEMLYTDRAGEGEGLPLTVDFQPFCPSETVIRFLMDMNGEVSGMASIVTRRNSIGTSFIGTVEDVYLLPSCRGQGLSRHLMQAVIDEARRIDLACLELTSKPRRKAANRLYQSLGFELVARANRSLGDRATNFYRLTLRP